MVIQERRSITVDEFEQFVNLPENSDRTFEYIGGEIIDVPSNPLVSKFAITIATFIRMHLFSNDIGHVTGEAGGYMVAGERYAPDVAFISYAKQPELPAKGYCPNPPDLAVEVVSSDSAAENDKLTIKLSNYLAVGTVVWIIRSAGKYIEVHQPGKPAQVFNENDTLDGGDVLPGFTLKVSDIFK